MEQLTFFKNEEKRFLNLKEASAWASQYINRRVTVANISYLIQYGRIKKYGNNGNPLINIEELKRYYDSIPNEKQWEKVLGKDINWHLSFAQYKEAERTKHVHRIHPYKGKFIPQLVEYFLDSHTDEYKKDVYFHKGDILLDPFCGSGTTLVQANELGLHAIGVDISFFNSLIANVKVGKHNIDLIAKVAYQLSSKLEHSLKNKNSIIFEEHLQSELAKFNAKHFPSPEYKRNVAKKIINESNYSKEREQEFFVIYKSLIEKYRIQLLRDKCDTFLDRWFLVPVREEIDFLSEEIKKINDTDVREVLTVILSRTARSCRATTHADLATLKDPVTAIYYCKKHGKICKPIFSTQKWWNFYVFDTIYRLKQFEKIRTNTFQVCLTGDSRTINLYEEIQRNNRTLAEIILKQKIRGIFTSPPYIGLIDYHEQHAYAYEIFGFKRRDEFEIGSKSQGQGEEKRNAYKKNIAEVLENCKKYLQSDYDIFIVANDKFNLYPQIAEMAGMKIINKFKRPVLNRVEKDRETPYSETIFHMKNM